MKKKVSQEKAAAVAIQACVPVLFPLEEEGRRRVISALRSLFLPDPMERIQPIALHILEQVVPHLAKGLVVQAVGNDAPGHLGAPDLPPLDREVLNPSAADLRQDLLAWVSRLTPEAYQDAAGALGTEKVRELMQLLGVADPSEMMQPQEPTGEDGQT